LLVASPALLTRIGAPRAPADLKSLPSAAGQHPPDPGGRHLWHLTGPDNVRQSVQHFPRLLTEDLWVIGESALAACAIAALPPVLCREAIDEGRLVQVLPGWPLPEQKLHVLYESRQGLTRAARALIDFISSHLRTELRHLQASTLRVGLSPYRNVNRDFPKPIPRRLPGSDG
jgi:DNA-binding transcriptional LysR family regulator